MKAVVYYSWSGKTEQKAKAYAKKHGAELFAVRDEKRPGTLKAYVAGSFSAMRMKKTSTMPLEIPFDRYDEIVVMAPVWAGHPAPAIHAAFEALPAGKDVRVVLVSASGSSSCKQKVENLIKGKGCKLIGFADIKG